MLMHPDVLPSSDIDADGIVAISCLHLSIQLYMGLSLSIVAKSLWRNAAAIETMAIIVRPSICSPHFHVSWHFLTNLLNGIS